MMVKECLYIFRLLNIDISVHDSVEVSVIKFSDDRWFSVYKASQCPPLCLTFSHLIYLYIRNTAIDIDNVQLSFTMMRNEQIPVDQAFYYERFSQSDTESRASTVPLEETSSCENGNTIVQPDFRENDQGMRVSSCSLREVTKHDYADQAYKEVMDAAAATVSPSESRRRKTGLGKRTREVTDLDSMLVRIYISLHLI